MLGAKYRAYISSNGLEVNLWDQYYGQSYLFDNNAGAPTRQWIPGYNLVNLSLTLRNTQVRHVIPGVKMATLAVYLTNILNRKYNATEYVTAGGYFNGNSIGAVLANPGAPRAFFLDARLTF